MVLTDVFMKAVEENAEYDLVDPHYQTVSKRLNAREIWRKVLKMRAETGEPYMIFIDTVNEARPQHHKDLGLMVRQSNLCTEIVLPTDNERTAVCCLGNINLERWDEFQGQFDEIAYHCVKALDNNLDSFCEMADPVEYKKAINSVKHERSIGLGVMGYHGMFMSKMVPLESLQARMLNNRSSSASGRPFAPPRRSSARSGDCRSTAGRGAIRTPPPSSRRPRRPSLPGGDALRRANLGNAHLQKTLPVPSL